jgi:hypothetical protein
MTGDGKIQSTLQALSRHCSTERATEITKRIAQFVAMDLRPISIVEGQGFSRLINYIEPGYQIPSRPHLTNICRNLYDSAKIRLLAQINSRPYVSSSTDIWTSRTQQAYLTVTVHFLTEEWIMESNVLLTREIPEKHTGINITERLKAAAKEWNITDEKLAAVVRDNAANMALTVDIIGNWNDIGCFGHTLQLAVNAGLNIDQLSRLTAVARKLVGHFKHSVTAVAALKEKQKAMSVAEHKLLQDVSTGWNSTYQMLDRLAEQRWTVYTVLHDENITRAEHRHYDLKPEQWDVVSQIVPTLKPLQIATTALCMDQNVTASLIFPVVHGLLKNHLTIKSDDLPVLKQFKVVVLNELIRRFKFDPENVAILASALDPRHKYLKFISEEECRLVHEVLLDKAQDIYFKMHATDDADEDFQEPPTKKRKESAISFLIGNYTDEPNLSGSNAELENLANYRP